MNLIDQRFDRVFADLRADREAFSAEMRALRAEAQADRHALRVAMQTDRQELRAEMRAELEALRVEMHSGFAELRSVLADTRRQMTQIVWSFGIGVLGIIGTTMMTAVLRGSF